MGLIEFRQGEKRLARPVYLVGGHLLLAGVGQQREGAKSGLTELWKLDGKLRPGRTCEFKFNNDCVGIDAKLVLDEPKCETEWRETVHPARRSGDGWEQRGDEPAGLASVHAGEPEPVQSEGAASDFAIA